MKVFFLSTSFPKTIVAVLFIVTGWMYSRPLSAQSTPGVVQPGAPGESGRIVDGDAVSGQKRPMFTEADVLFMQGMIPHHAQALEMTALVPDRTDTRSLHRIALRIEVAQRDEIAWMQRWLQDRNEEVPESGVHAHHHGGHSVLMPGMLTPEQMAQLANASGPDFDRLFLTLMIQHHVGALIMVRDLFATPGAAQVPEMYRFASDIDADQRAEIQRMRSVLESLAAAQDPK